MSSAHDAQFGPAGWDIIRAGQRLGQRGLIAGAEGNLSVRLSGELILITRAGVRKDELTINDLLLVDHGGSVVRGAGPPSTELRLHLSAYQASTDIQAVVHSHPIHATAFAAAEQVPTWTAMAESCAFLGPVVLAPYATPGSAALSEHVRTSLQGSRAVLLAHHGAVTVGASLDEAVQRTELLERLCAIECQARALGGLIPLPDAEVRRLRQD